MSQKNSISGKSAGSKRPSGGIIFPKPADHSAQSSYGEQEAGTGAGKMPPDLRSRKS
ncbi:MAG: hypothetical protein AAGU23_02265 [Bacillota bacterium]